MISSQDPSFSEDIRTPCRDRRGSTRLISARIDSGVPGAVVVVRAAMKLVCLGFETKQLGTRLRVGPVPAISSTPVEYSMAFGCHASGFVPVTHGRLVQMAPTAWS